MPVPHNPEDYPLDYRRVIAAYPQALQIEWRNFREHPYYIVKDRKNEYYIDAADSLPRPLQLSEEEILKGVESIYTSQRDSSTTYPRHTYLPARTFRDLLSRHEQYVSRTTPASRLEDNGGRPGPERLLHSPGNGNHPPCRHLLPLEYWSYTALHRMRLPGLNSNATLRKTVLWVLLLGGTAVCITGVGVKV